MVIYFLIVFSFYSLLLLTLRIGWRRSIHQPDDVPNDATQFISVVVAMRNEEQHIENFLRNISIQNYPLTNFEVILVDDHSTDSSLNLAQRFAKENMKIISLPADQVGKKCALTKGIALAKGELIATTDVDCLLPPRWLKNTNAAFRRKEIQLSIGMVVMKDNNTFFSRWQTLEFASVMGTAIATLGFHQPTMCNGANLAFRKSAFVAVGGYTGNEHIASGDDEFLMRKIHQKFPKSIGLMKAPTAVVITQPQKSVNDFLNQRLRWASKWKFNSSWVAKALAVFIFLSQVSWLLLLSSFFIEECRRSLVLILSAKIIIDFIFYFPILRFMKIRLRVIPFLGLQILYPIYIIVVAIFSPWKTTPWKDRYNS